MKQPKHQQAVSSGVEALIAQLREDGVEEGRKEAEAMVAAAQEEARTLLAQARAEAAQIQAQAQAENAAQRAAGEDALRAAARDAILRLRQDLLERFSADVRAMVSEAMADPALIKAMILEVAGGARDHAGVAPGEAIAVVPASAATPLEDLRQDLEALRAAPATQLVLAHAGRILREGVLLGAEGQGILLRLRDGDLEIDLTDAAVAQVLLAHLQPRFRALFDGIIR